MGYALYAVGNTVMMILLYFTDYFGAVLCAAIFAGAATVLTVIAQFLPVTLMGFGFLLGSSAFLLAAVVRLAVFTDNLPYRVLGAQPIVATEKRGWFTKLGESLDEFDERLHGASERKEA